MADESEIAVPTPELTAIAELQPHPRNYRHHPPDQVEHIVQSLRANGLYRNVVIARDGTILAGHGVVQAAEAAGIEKIPVIRLDCDADDPRALKVLTGDNELARLAEVDDRRLSEILRDVREASVEGLLGTGFDDQRLAALLMVTRPASEIRTVDEAAQWVGLPDFSPSETDIVLVLHFDDEAGRDELIESIGVTISKKTRATWSAWWPPREKQDLASLRFDGDRAAAAAAADGTDG